jgi:hypothetical protein
MTGKKPVASSRSRLRRFAELLSKREKKFFSSSRRGRQ